MPKVDRDPEDDNKVSAKAILQYIVIAVVVVAYIYLVLITVGWNKYFEF